MFIIFDTETTGLPKNWNAPITDTDNWPRCVQIAWQVHDKYGNVIEHEDYLIKPEGYNIPYDAEQIHGISTELANEKGEDLEKVLYLFNEALSKATYVVGHNVEFDTNIMGCEYYRMNIDSPMSNMSVLDSCTETTATLCQIPGGRGGKFKLPTLTELHQHLFNIPFDEAHNATADVEATTRCFLELIRLEVFTENEIKIEEKYFQNFKQYNTEPTKVIGLKHLNLKAESEKLRNKKTAPNQPSVEIEISEELKKASFAHLHCHSQFSILQSTSSINGLVNSAIKSGMNALAITDTGNMMNAFNFVQAGFGHYSKAVAHNDKIDLAKDIKKRISEAEEIILEYDHIDEVVDDGKETKPKKVRVNLKNLTEEWEALKKRKENKEEVELEYVTTELVDDEEKEKRIPVDLDYDQNEYKIPFKPISGCEFNVCEDHTNKSSKDNGYQIVMLAKNKNGYLNMAKMSSLSHTDGFYYVPRIDKKIIEQYKEDIMVLSGNLYGEIPNKILNIGEAQAEEALLWWKEQFGDDFYLELMRHGQENEDHVNEVLIKFSKKHNVKLIATNNTFYTDQEEADAHDILLCVKDGEKTATPKGRGRGFRYGLPNNQYYFKSEDEMKELFKDIPEAIINIQEIIDKVEVFKLSRNVLLPKFDIPKQFIDPQDEIDGGVRGENAYLRHLTYEGAKIRYGDVLDEDTIERLDFELEIIKKTGYPGYFLIVWDFILEARKMDVSVGPGRGSAAGSAVAYCLWITNIDPIKYDLLFERFLNPDRVSMPDIDIDFDDEGRQRVIDFVIEKYGAPQVAQIITYGSMAAKSSIRDTARALDLPLNEADRIAKLIPGVKLQHIFGEDPKSKGKIKGLKSEELECVEELRRISEGDNLEAETINQARNLEGSIRNTGIHACGVIITPEPITNLVPVATAKDSDMYVTQFDNGVVESAGLLKMDFLGLKTLTLIKDTVKIVKAKHNIDLIPDDFPLDDEETYKLFQRGETIGIFQYESPGMQKHMKSLKPTEFADLIAMNALYRPGPMEYIPSFIDRKHGIEEITYDLEGMEDYLKETYGITVYQEQVMLLSQKLANFTKGQADMLRKAMGKKIFALLEKLKPQFIEGGKSNGHDEKILEKVWKDWEKFAAYAFNKSHSTCYAYIAYQTAYLKAHYPAEYMAAVLSNNMNDIKQVTFFMEECKRAGIPVLGPDVNESYYKFAVNNEGAVRFGMGAIKGVGAGAIEAIINERKQNGNFTSIFDMTKRVDLRAANKRAFDGLVMAGALDSFKNAHRAQYYKTDEKGITFIERAIRFGNKYQENKNSAQVSLFGEASEIQFPEPEIPIAEEWGVMEKLSKEKEMVGIYISGHPLDDYKTEIDCYCNGNTAILQDLKNIEGREVAIGGIISDVEHRIAKNGNGWASFTLDDYEGSYEFRIFSEEYLKFKHFLVPNSFVYIKLVGRKNYYNDDIRISFNSIQLLHDILDKYSKKISISIGINEINETKISELYRLLEKFKGTKILNFVILDTKEKLSLNMPSRSLKVNISTEFLEELEKQEINFKLN
ncbi:DNA polymerase III subunit alpha [Lutibacter sp. TH_r2]|uniref:DNA polymerase III subunit alpha n=1 Tax=Lutibacter sp. TH_r2 TaxID=3082083 RepID=UPI002954DCDD|nr:DNA polymerase III subunit alpha [Lutibacter sp. TH_r2]MDV7187755.1 DNA polymerase III subunit alpha [Lutibacter sp. TH_r2]